MSKTLHTLLSDGDLSLGVTITFGDGAILLDVEGHRDFNDAPIIYLGMWEGQAELVFSHTVDAEEPTTIHFPQARAELRGRNRVLRCKTPACVAAGLHEFFVPRLRVHEHGHPIDEPHNWESPERFRCVSCLCVPAWHHPAGKEET
tara:strand:- start:1254 stop:1691 length:438 start_codon:yes stop_codon:yes gene_type:complete